MLPLADVLDFPAGEIDRYLVAILYFRRGLRTFGDRQANVQGIAIENAGKIGRDNAGHAAPLDSQRCVLSRGAAAKVMPAHHNFAPRRLGRKIGINILHTMFGQLRRVRGGKITGRDDHIRIYIIAIFNRFPTKLHKKTSFSGFYKLAGLVMAP